MVVSAAVLSAAVSRSCYKISCFRKRNPACNCAAVPTQLFQIDTSFSIAPQAKQARASSSKESRVSLVTTNTKRTQFHKHDLVISKPNFTSKSFGKLQEQ